MMPEAKPSVAGREEIVQTIASLSLLEPSVIQEVEEKFLLQGNTRNDAEAFAHFLVQSQLLTSYQVERILKGKLDELRVGPFLLQEIIYDGYLGPIYRAARKEDRAPITLNLLPLRDLLSLTKSRKILRKFLALPRLSQILAFQELNSASGFHFLQWEAFEGKAYLDHWSTLGSARDRMHDFVPRLPSLLRELHLCHEAGIVHGLLSPNVLGLRPGELVLLEMGVGMLIAENLTHENSMLDTLSTSQAALAIIDFVAPETIEEPTRRTITADIYSLGCVCFYLLTGRTPYAQGSVVDKMIAHATAAIPEVCSLEPEIPQALSLLLARMMQKDPASRPQSCLDIAQELELLLQDHPNIFSAPEALPSQFQTQVFLDHPTKNAHDSLEEEFERDWALVDTPPENCFSPSHHDDDDQGMISFDYNVPEGSEHAMDGIFDHEEQNDDSINPKDGFSVTNSAPGREDSGNTEADLDIQTPVKLETFLSERADQIGSRSEEGKNATREPIEPPNIQINLAARDTDKSRLELILDNKIPEISRPLSWRTKRNPTETEGPGKLRKGFGHFLKSLSSKSDFVHISLYGPGRVTPGSKVPIVIYLHTAESAQSIRTLSRAIWHAESLLGTVVTAEKIFHGEDFSIQLELEHVGLSHTFKNMKWEGQTSTRKLEMFVPVESVAMLVEGTGKASISGKVVAQFPIAFQIVNKSL